MKPAVLRGLHPECWVSSGALAGVAGDADDVSPTCCDEVRNEEQIHHHLDIINSFITNHQF